jgi:hypothetical protein
LIARWRPMTDQDEREPGAGLFSNDIFDSISGK